MKGITFVTQTFSYVDVIEKSHFNGVNYIWKEFLFHSTIRLKKPILQLIGDYFQDISCL